MEKVGAWAEALLKKIELPYTDLAANLIGMRSDGIKDLRHGYLIDEEWQEDDQHEFPRNNRKAHFHLENAEHFIVAATFHEDIDSFISEWLGDFMVRKNSAIGKAKNADHHIDIDSANVKVFGGHHHIKLMHSPQVYAFISAKIKDLLLIT